MGNLKATTYLRRRRRWLGLDASAAAATRLHPERVVSRSAAGWLCLIYMVRAHRQKIQFAYMGLRGPKDPNITKDDCKIEPKMN
jgi:hypothetical protein